MMGFLDVLDWRDVVSVFWYLFGRSSGIRGDRSAREVTFYAGENTQHFVDSGLIAEIVPTPLAESAGAQSPQSGD